MRQNLEFRGGSLVLFGDILLVALLTTITFGLYFPWGYARLRRTVLTHTYYRNQPLQFDGTGGQLIGVWLKILFFTLITLGVYALLMYPSVAILKWEAEHTIMPNGRRLEYRGTALDLFGEFLVVAILSLLTFGIYSFWGYVRLRRHTVEHCFVDGQPLEFTGTGGQYLGIALVNWLLSIITFGFYPLVGAAAVRELRWDTQNTLVPVLQAAPQYLAYARDDRPIQVNVTVNR